MSKLLEDIRKIFRHEEPDPWDGSAKPEPKEITHEEMEKAVERMNRTKNKSVMVPLILQILTLLWILGHGAILYVSYGTPISGGILVIVVVNLVFNIHYFTLLNKERESRR